MAMEAVLNGIKSAVIDKAKAERSISDKDIDKNVLRAELEKLKAGVDSFDFDMMNDASQILQEYTDAEGIGEDISEILNKKLGGDYEHVIYLVDIMLKNL